jgi:hypothetical protein
MAMDTPAEIAEALGIRDDALDQAAKTLAQCAGQVFHPPYGGASLGDILNWAALKQALENEGLTIVPKSPTADMRKAFRKGWFRTFKQRYAAMFEEAWRTWDCTNETDENRFGMAAPHDRKKCGREHLGQPV